MGQGTVRGGTSNKIRGTARALGVPRRHLGIASYFQTFRFCRGCVIPKVHPGHVSKYHLIPKIRSPCELVVIELGESRTQYALQTEINFGN